ncbi:MAG TPA: hypothetical protein VH593_06095, partial [Ktedonobacteraceae bacterium]
MQPTQVQQQLRDLATAMRKGDAIPLTGTLYYKDDGGAHHACALGRAALGSGWIPGTYFHGGYIWLEEHFGVLEMCF